MKVSVIASDLHRVLDRGSASLFFPALASNHDFHTMAFTLATVPTPHLLNVFEALKHRSSSVSTPESRQFS
jgi:hypothetical protein